MTWSNLSTAERITKVRQLKSASRTEQANYLGVSLQTLSAFCSEHMRPSNDNDIWSTLSDAERREQVIELYEVHGQIKKVADLLGCNRSVIYRFCREHDLAGLINRRVWHSGPPMIPVPKEPPETWFVLAGTPVGLLDLTEHTCRWPVGTETGSKQLFCGCHTGDSSYCEVHALMARGSGE